MECPKCRAPNPDSKRFCSDCGSPLVSTCASCGAPSVPGKRFCGDCGAPLSVSAGVSSATAIPSPAADASRDAPPSSSALASAGAERRQLTVMFCDLVGSTELAARMDLEDLRDVIDAYHRC